MTDMERIAVALESIAASLVKLANPVEAVEERQPPNVRWSEPEMAALTAPIF